MKRSSPGFFDLSDRLEALSKCGDPLEKLNKQIDFEIFRDALEKAFAFHKGKAGRPFYDAILILKMLVLQSLYTLSDEQLEFQVKDRLSFMRFLGISLHDRVPDTKTIWLYRERLTRKKLLDKIFVAFNSHLNQQGYIAMSGTIVDASIIQAPRQRLTKKEKEEIKSGKTPEDWSIHKTRQKDIDATYTVKHTKKKADAKNDLIIPFHGYKTHVGIDSKHGFIRTQELTTASMFDGHMLEKLVDKENTSSNVYADTAYHAKANLEMLEEKGFTSQMHKKKPRLKVMPEKTKHSNTRKSKIRAKVEHVFAVLKDQMKLFIRTIGIARATTKIKLAHLTYNIKRLVYWQTRKPYPKCV